MHSRGRTGESDLLSNNDKRIKRAGGIVKTTLGFIIASTTALLAKYDISEVLGYISS